MSPTIYQRLHFGLLKFGAVHLPLRISEEDIKGVEDIPYECLFLSVAFEKHPWRYYIFRDAEHNPNHWFRFGHHTGASITTTGKFAKHVDFTTQPVVEYRNRIMGYWENASEKEKREFLKLYDGREGNFRDLQRIGLIQPSGPVV